MALAIAVPKMKPRDSAPSTTSIPVLRNGLAINSTDMARPDGSAISGAGSALRWLLERSSLRWDRGRVAAVVDYLNSYRVDLSIQAAPDARVDPWEYIQQHLLPGKNVIEIEGRNDGGLVASDRAAGEELARDHIDLLGAGPARHAVVAELEQAPLADELEELLGAVTTGEGPEAGPRAPGENDDVHHAPSLSCRRENGRALRRGSARSAGAFAKAAERC